MNIDSNCVVAIHYTLTDDGGQVLDTSDGREPLAYLHGAGNIIPGLENELVGKSVGDELSVTVQPELGYGEVDPNLVQNVPKDAFQGMDQLEAGMQFQATDQDGAVQLVTVKSIGETDVEVDGNHPLAGQTLNFDVKVESVREATEEELEHGHPHTPGQEHH